MSANWIRTTLARTARRSLADRRPRLRLNHLEDRTAPAAFKLGAASFDSADAVATDGAGNMYVSGTFNGTVDFDPGVGVVERTSTGSADAYVAKYTAGGSFLWVGQLVDSSAPDMVVNNDGTLVVTGGFTGTVDFDFGTGTRFLTSTSIGTILLPTAYVAKYTYAGTLEWAQPLGGPQNGTLSAATNGLTIAVDASGNVYSAGTQTNGVVDYDPGLGAGSLINVSGNANTYIHKFTSTGNFVWVKQFANDPSISAGVWPAELGVDSAQNVYVTGIFVGRVDFNGGQTNYTSTFDIPVPAGGGDGYVAKLFNNGALAHVVRIGSSAGREDGYDLAVASDGTAFVAGHFQGMTTVDTTGADTTLVSAGGWDGFALRLTPTGGLGWAQRFGGIGHDGAHAIYREGNDFLYLTGYFSDTADFDPGAGTVNRTSNGLSDVFALKLGTGGGNLISVWNYGGTGTDDGNAIVANTTNVFLAGRFSNTVDFDPYAGVQNLTSSGQTDGFVNVFPLVPPNQPPIANNDAYEVNEDVLLTVPVATGVLVNDTDPEGAALTASVVANPSHAATFTFNANGSFTYRATANYFGTDTFTYRVSDGVNQSNTATVTITVRPVNDAPFPSPIVTERTIDEDTTVSGQLNAIDRDGDPITFTRLQGPVNGSITFNPDGTYEYTPNANFTGIDEILFQVSDPAGASNLGGLRFRIKPVNDAPTGVGDTFTVAEDTPLVISASPVTRLRMVSEPHEPPEWIGQGLTYEYTPANATFSSDVNFDNGVEIDVDPPAPGEWWNLNFAAPGNAALTPGTTYLNAQRFPFQAADRPGLDVSGTGRGSNTLTGQFRVFDVVYNGGDITRFAAAFEQHSEGAPPALLGWVMFNSTFGAGAGVLANDTDLEADLLLGATLVAGPANGTLNFAGDGTFTYTPNPNFHGTDTFTYKANDGRADSPVTTVTINVTAVNDAPVASDGSASTDEDTSLNGTAAAADVDGDSLTYTVVSGPTNGTLASFNSSTGAFQYVPNANYNGPDSFTFKVNDGTVDSNTATFAITVRSINDAPVANNASFTTAEDTSVNGSLTATDIDGDPLTFSKVADPAHGSVTVNSDGTFTYIPAANYHGPDSFTFRANDGTANSNTATVSLTVTPVNDAPLASNASVSTPEDTPLDGTASATDVDGDTLSYAVVTSPTQGTLSFNTTTGAYTYTPNANYNGSDSFTFRASDGTLNSNTATVSITVTAVNDAPVAAGGSFTTAEDTSVNGTVTATDIEGDPLTFSKVADPAHGTVVVNSDGTFTYTPASNYHGPDSFTFRANDGSANSNTATVSITVTPVNDAPVAANASISTPEDTPKTATVVASDVDGNTLTYAVVASPANGTLTFNTTSGEYTYTPNANYNGSDSFTFRASDGTVNSNTATVSITVTAVNDAPLANGASITTAEDTAHSGTLSATDLDGDTLTFSKVTDPTHGTVAVNSNGTFTYTPTANYHGSDSFTFKVNDGTVDSNTATVSITVTPVNDAPVASNGSATTPEDTPLDGNTTATDVDGDTLSYTVVTAPAHGTLTLNTNGSFRYTPAAGYNGPDSFTFKANDGTVDSNTATFSITVGSVNDPPVASNASVTTAEDTAHSGTLSATDPDGDPLTFSKVTDPTHGTVVVNSNGTFTYTPAANYNGSDSFTFKVNDGTIDSNTATISITVTSVNDAPVASNASISTPEDTAKTGTAAATDVDGDTLTYAVVASPANGTLTFNTTTGAYTYTPNANYNGSDSFTFRATDGTANSNTATVSITVTAVNDAPVANGASVTTAEDTPANGTLTATDVDGNTLTFSKVADPSHGTVTVNSNGTFTYTPAANYHGSDSFTFKVNDGTVDSNTATISITVTSVNDAPVANSGSFSTPEDTPFDGNATAIDVDGDTLTYTVVTAPTHGTLALNANGTFRYTPATNYIGPDSFTFKANDGTIDSNTATFSITVGSINDPPVANNASVSTAEDTAHSGTLSATDPDGDPLTFSKVADPSHGTVVVNSDGTFTYTPAANYHGPDSFTFRASDGTLNSNTATVSITVTSVNDAPVAGNASISTPEDTAKTGTAAATDVDGDTLTYAVVASPANGTLTFNTTTGAYTYTPNANYNGSDSFTFRASDGTLNSNTATVSIAVTAVNDAPVANGASVTTAEDTPANGTLTATDVDGDTLTFSKVADPAHGTVTVNSNGTFTYTPAANYHGPDSFTFRANDGTTNSNTATISITVTSVNDAPVASNGNLAATEDTPTDGTVAAADVDGDTLTYSIVAGPAHGTLTDFNTATGAYTYAPVANYNGTDSFTFRANDGTVNSNTATVSISVAAVNDVPVAANASVTTAEDTPKSGTLVATDADGDTLTFSRVAGPSHGTVVVNADGSYIYTPTANYNGTDSFTFKANDGRVDSNTATVSITVTSVNDAPVASNGSLTTAANVAADGTLVAADADGDPLSFRIVSGPAHGTLTSFNAATGAYTYTPEANYNGPDSFTFAANDGTTDSNTATVTVTVGASNNRQPTARKDNANTNEDTPVTIAVLANDSDPDGDPLSVSAVTEPAHGTATINSNGTVTYTPEPNYNGTDTFTYTVSDGRGGTATAEVKVKVRAVNDAPVANEGTFTTNEDTRLLDRLSATDVDGDRLIFRKVSGPSHGTLTVNQNGRFDYKPAANFHGTDTFIFRVSDGRLRSEDTTVKITVLPVNDVPVAKNDFYDAVAGVELAVPAAGVLANDTDADGDPLTAVLVDGPHHGTLTFNSDGSFRYTPILGFQGTDSFTYLPTDGTANGNVATVSIDVDRPANTAGNVTGSGSLDGGARKFNMNFRSRAQRGGGFTFSGDIDFQDTQNNLRLDGTTIRSLRVDQDGTRAVITGTAKVNGRAGYEFTLIVEDLGEPGNGSDTFRILITGPQNFAYDSLEHSTNQGILDSGNLQVHQQP